MRVKPTLKSNFLAGLALSAPVIVTLFVIQVASNWVFGALTPIVEGTGAKVLTGNLLLAQLLVGAVIVGLITVVGWVAQYSVGRALFGRAGRTMDFIPVVRTIYTSVRQVASSVTNRASEYESVVLVEYPRDGMYSIGLVTGESPSVAENLADDDVYNVFFPASPNPTQGKLLMIPESRIHETDMSVGRGFQLLMTTGMAEKQPVMEFDEDELGSDFDEFATQ
ncbi:MAG: DUF502 domain-containing protein [Haloarculaceae archaeon]